MSTYDFLWGSYSPVPVRPWRLPRRAPRMKDFNLLERAWRWLQWRLHRQPAAYRPCKLGRWLRKQTVW